jgi:hypothetical protein
VKKGDWYLVSDSEGVLSLTHIKMVNWPSNELAFDMYARAYGYTPIPVDDYTLAGYLTDMSDAKSAHKEVTRVPAKTARNLLQLLQRKLP